MNDPDILQRYNDILHDAPELADTVMRLERAAAQYRTAVPPATLRTTWGTAREGTLHEIGLFGPGIVTPGVVRRPDALPGGVPRSVLHPRRPARQWAEMAAGLLAFVLVAAVLMAVLDQSDDRRDALGDGKAVAGGAISGSALAVGQGEYRYVSSESTELRLAVGPDGTMLAALCARSREVWVDATGTGRMREVGGQVSYLSSADQAAWDAAGMTPSCNTGSETSRDIGPDGFSVEDIAGLPLNPRDLAVVIRQRAEDADPPADTEAFVVIGDLLRNPLTSPDLVAALYEVATTVPGVEIDAHATDPSGRAATAISITTDYWGARERRTLMLDATHTHLIYEEDVLLEHADWTAATPPAVIDAASYAGWATLDALPAN